MELKLAVVHGLKNARMLADQIRKGECEYDLVEVMACPGGCISGAGQPINPETTTKQLRAGGLFETDKTLQLHASQDNPYLQKCYQETLGDIGGHTAHEWLHTHYHSRKRFDDDSFTVMEGTETNKLQVCVCVGTSCYVRGSQKLLERVMQYVNEENVDEAVDVRATFCFEACDRGPTVRIGDKVINKCTLDDVKREIRKQRTAVR